MRRIWRVFVARNKEWYRDRAALAWTIAFPVLIIFGFAFAFDNPNPTSYKVGVINYDVDSPLEEDKEFFATRFVKFIPFPDTEIAIDKVSHHQIDLVIDPKSKNYWINTESPNGYLATKILIESDASDQAAGAWRRIEVSTRNIRYVDWVIPGVLAMNMMFGALYGLGYVLVRYRKDGVLRRFKASPISAFEFLTAQVMSRLLIVVLSSVLVFIGCDFVIGFKMLGSHLDLLIVFTLGSACMISVGMIVAARTTSKEFADGILNLLAWPMMLGSGVWFSLEGTNPALQKAAQFLPLTHIVDAMRAIMTEGTAITSLGYNIGVLVAATIVFSTIGLLLFRWE